MALGCLGALLLLCAGACAGSQRVAQAPADAGSALDTSSIDASDGGRGDAGRCQLRCGDLAECCAEGEECTLDGCRPPCEGTRCGESGALCCDVGQLCVGQTCVAPGDVCGGEEDCLRVDTCDPVVGRCVPVPEGAACTYEPPTAVFTPTVKWAWEARHVANPPVVVQVDDDNHDGLVDRRDNPDIVVPSYDDHVTEPNFQLVGVHLTALSGKDGSVIWDVDAGPDYRICVPETRGIAAGDLDADGLVELVALVSPVAESCNLNNNPKYLAVFDHQGQLAAVSTERISTNFTGQRATTEIQLADLEGDGDIDIITGHSVFTAQAELRWYLDAPGETYQATVDLDGDGTLELVTGRAVYSDTGELRWRARGEDLPAVAGTQIAVARFIEAGAPPGGQIAVVGSSGFSILDGTTGMVLLGPVRFSVGGRAGGPLTVADFDGDRRVEIASAGDDFVSVIDPVDGRADRDYTLWSLPSEDVTGGSTGSTVFDFENDGRAEVVLADECHVKVLDGMTGAVLWYASNASATASEYPVVADLDSDANAELIVVANMNFDRDVHYRCDERSLPHTGLIKGVRVYEDAEDNWVATRAVWNQHAYHLSNIDESGQLPRVEEPSWSTHNSWRLNRLPDEEIFLAPDLRIVALSANTNGCPTNVHLRARLLNAGSRGVPAGVKVSFYGGEPPSRGEYLGTATSTRALLSGEGEWVEIDAFPPPSADDGVFECFAVADEDEARREAHNECLEDNNVGLASAVDCSGLI